MRIWCSVFCCVVGCLSSQTSAADAIRTPVTVFQNQQEGYNVFRIPALVRAANGDLLAFCEAREGGDASAIDLVLKRSRDQGQTWSALQVVQPRTAFADLYPPVTPVTVGNPAPVVDLMDPQHPGRIWLPFTVENDRVFVAFTDDHGRSWSPARDITSDVKREEWGWYATGPVHSIQLADGPHAGRLVVPCDHRKGTDGRDDGPNGAHVFYSDDHGSTWHMGAVDDTYDDGLNANETSVVELPGGRLYFNTRDQHGDAPGTRGSAWSSDGGASFESAEGPYRWFRPVPEVLDPPVVQCSLLRVSFAGRSEARDVVLFSGPDEDGPSGKGRSDLRIRFSLDGAQSWQDGPLLHTGPAAYSDLVRIHSDNPEIGVLFECGDAGRRASDRIAFLVFSVNDLVGHVRD